MSKRTKTTTLFNKNHITITKVENVEHKSSYVLVNSIDKSGNNGIWWYGDRNKKRTIIERCESKLGFYYDKEVTVYDERYKECSSRTIEIKVYLNDVEYMLTYLKQYNGIWVDVEKHPWDLVPNDKAIADHYITDLLNEVNRLFDIIKENKLNIYERQISDGVMPFDEFKRKTYKDLFVYPEGPKYQTDKEKILSHGFDLITSFRKM